MNYLAERFDKRLVLYNYFIAGVIPQEGGTLSQGTAARGNVPAPPQGTIAGANQNIPHQRTATANTRRAHSEQEDFDAIVPASLQTEGAAFNYIDVYDLQEIGNVSPKEI